MKKFLVLLIIVLLVASVVSGCKKVPGDGGLATIRGKVMGYHYNTAGVLKDSGYYAGATVYLEYGDDTYPSQSEKTSYTGDYAFPFLQEGKYTVYVLTRCDTCPLSQSADIIKTEITSRRQELILRDLRTNF